MLQYTKKLNPAVFVPTFFLVILEIAKTFSSILLPQYFIDDITNRSSIRQTMFHLAILIIAIFGIQIFRAAITPYILKAYNQGDANTALDYAFHYVKMEYKDQENDEIRNTQEKLRRNVTANGFVVVFIFQMRDKFFSTAEIYMNIMRKNIIHLFRPCFKITNYFHSL